MNGLIMVTSRSCESGRTTCCVTELPVGFQSLSGTAPVSQINVPFGCVTRKLATDKSLVATSSGFNPKRPVSLMWRVPQSNTYSLIARGGRALCPAAACPAPCAKAANTSAKTTVATGKRDVLRFIFQRSVVQQVWLHQQRDAQLATCERTLPPFSVGQIAPGVQPDPRADG